MTLRSYFDQDLSVAIVFAVLGVIAGYASFTLNNSTMAFVLMIVVALVFYFIVKKAAHVKQDRRWWIGNAFIVYIFLWFVSWIVYYNLGLL